MYFYTVDAQLKTFIDRCVPRYTEMSDKDFYYILTAADSDKSAFDKSIECIRGFTLDCLDGAKEKGIIRGAGVFEKGEIKDKSEYKECYNMGKKRLKQFKETDIYGKHLDKKKANHNS